MVCDSHAAKTTLHQSGYNRAPLPPKHLMSHQSLKRRHLRLPFPFAASSSGLSKDLSPTAFFPFFFLFLTDLSLGSSEDSASSSVNSSMPSSSGSSSIPSSSGSSSISSSSGSSSIPSSSGSSSIPSSSGFSTTSMAASSKLSSASSSAL